MARIRMIGLAIPLPCRRMAQLLRLGRMGTMVVEVTPDTSGCISTPAEGGCNGVVTWTGQTQVTGLATRCHYRPTAPFLPSVRFSPMVSTALIQAECTCINGFPIHHGNHWDPRLTEQEPMIGSGSPSLSRTTAPSWPWEAGAMTQVAAMPAMFGCLHGRARIGPNGGTTLPVHPRTTTLATRFPCQPMDPCLLVVVINQTMVLDM